MHKAHQVHVTTSGNRGAPPSGVMLHYLERIERLEKEKIVINNTIEKMFQEASGNGFDVKVMKELLELRKLGQEDSEEAGSSFDVYLHYRTLFAGAPSGSSEWDCLC